MVWPMVNGINKDLYKNHNNHHLFTNSYNYDPDLDTSRKLSAIGYLLFFAQIRFYGFYKMIVNRRWFDCLIVSFHYYVLSRQRIIYFICATFLASFYAFHIYLMSHERQKRYKKKITDDFITHQMETARDIPFPGVFWLIVMGGMHYQVEHHLFPQIHCYCRLKP